MGKMLASPAKNQGTEPHPSRPHPTSHDSNDKIPIVAVDIAPWDGMWAKENDDAHWLLYKNITVSKY